MVTKVVDQIGLVMKAGEEAYDRTMNLVADQLVGGDATALALLRAVRAHFEDALSLKRTDANRKVNARLAEKQTEFLVDSIRRSSQCSKCGQEVYEGMEGHFTRCCNNYYHERHQGEAKFAVISANGANGGQAAFGKCRLCGNDFNKRPNTVDAVVDSIMTDPQVVLDKDRVDGAYENAKQAQRKRINDNGAGIVQRRHDLPNGAQIDVLRGKAAQAQFDVTHRNTTLLPHAMANLNALQTALLQTMPTVETSNADLAKQLDANYNQVEQLRREAVVYVQDMLDINGVVQSTYTTPRDWSQVKEDTSLFFDAIVDKVGSEIINVWQGDSTGIVGDPEAFYIFLTENGAAIMNDVAQKVQTEEQDAIDADNERIKNSGDALQNLHYAQAKLRVLKTNYTDNDPTVLQTLHDTVTAVDKDVRTLTAANTAAGRERDFGILKRQALESGYFKEQVWRNLYKKVSDDDYQAAVVQSAAQDGFDPAKTDDSIDPTLAVVHFFNQTFPTDDRDGSGVGGGAGSGTHHAGSSNQNSGGHGQSQFYQRPGLNSVLGRAVALIEQQDADNAELQRLNVVYKETADTHHQGKLTAKIQEMTKKLQKQGEAYERESSVLRNTLFYTDALAQQKERLELDKARKQHELAQTKHASTLTATATDALMKNDIAQKNIAHAQIEANAASIAKYNAIHIDFAENVRKHNRALALIDTENDQKITADEVRKAEGAQLEFYKDTFAFNKEALQTAIEEQKQATQIKNIQNEEKKYFKQQHLETMQSIKHQDALETAALKKEGYREIKENRAYLVKMNTVEKNEALEKKRFDDAIAKEDALQRRELAVEGQKQRHDILTVLLSDAKTEKTHAATVLANNKKNEDLVLNIARTKEEARLALQSQQIDAFTTQNYRAGVARDLANAHVKGLNKYVNYFQDQYAKQTAINRDSGTPGNYSDDFVVTLEDFVQNVIKNDAPVYEGNVAFKSIQDAAERMLGDVKRGVGDYALSLEAKIEASGKGAMVQKYLETLATTSQTMFARAYDEMDNVLAKNGVGRILKSKLQMIDNMLMPPQLTDESLNKRLAGTSDVPTQHSIRKLLSANDALTPQDISTLITGGIQGNFGTLAVSLQGLQRYFTTARQSESIPAKKHVMDANMATLLSFAKENREMILTNADIFYQGIVGAAATEEIDKVKKATTKALENNQLEKQLVQTGTSNLPQDMPHALASRLPVTSTATMALQRKMQSDRGDKTSARQGVQFFEVMAARLSQQKYRQHYIDSEYADGQRFAERLKLKGGKRSHKRKHGKDDDDDEKKKRGDKTTIVRVKVKLNKRSAKTKAKQKKEVDEVDEEGEHGNVVKVKVK